MIYKNKEIMGAIFDLDGTLFDSMSAWHKIDVVFFQSHGMKVPADYHEKIAHMNLQMCAKYTKEVYGFAEDIEQIMRIWNEIASEIYANDVQLKPGALQLLRYFKEHGVKMSIATANADYLYMPCLKRLDIVSYFEFANDVDKCGAGKDSPKIFIDCAEMMDVPISKCIVFEDTLRALQVAAKAGFITSAVREVTNEEKKKKEISDFYFSSFVDFFS